MLVGAEWEILLQRATQKRLEKFAQIRGAIGPRRGSGEGAWRCAAGFQSQSFAWAPRPNFRRPAEGDHALSTQEGGATARAVLACQMAIFQSMLSCKSLLSPALPIFLAQYPGEG